MHNTSKITKTVILRELFWYIKNVASEGKGVDFTALVNGAGLKNTIRQPAFDSPLPY